MKKGGKIDTQKRAIKKVAKSGSQGIEKQVTKNRERGITLIALVVTIIIMLILAAVTLNMALGDNGLIQMAKFATNKYEQAAINESLAMQGLVNDLNNPWSVAPTTTTTPPPTTTTPSGGTGGGTTEGQITAEELTKDDYGGYVDYKLDLNGDNDTTNDWRIFYVGDASNGEANGRIFLIAADYVPNTNPALTDAKDSTHANMTKNSSSGWNVCTSYWSSSSSAEYHCNDGRESKANKQKGQCSFPEVFMTTGKYCASDRHYYCSDHVGDDGKSGNANSRLASALQCTGNWKPFVEKSTKGVCANYAIGGPTLEMWVASWSEKHGTEEAGKTGKIIYANGKNDSADNLGYYVGTSNNCTSTSCDLSSTEGYNDTLYFPHKDQFQNLDLFDQTKSTEPVDGGPPSESDNASCYGYWLSSPSCYDHGLLMKVKYNGSVTGSDYSSFYGVRPVVSLKSNVKLTKRNGTGERVVYDINM